MRLHGHWKLFFAALLAALFILTATPAVADLGVGIIHGEIAMKDNYPFSIGLTPTLAGLLLLYFLSRRFRLRIERRR